MSYSRETKVGVQQPAPELRENTTGGPLATQATPQSVPYYRPRRVVRTGLEKVGFWVVVVAALVVLAVLLGAVLPPLVGGLVAGAYTGAFAGLLTLMNLSRSSGWANALLGRRVFPVIRAGEGEIWRLATVNAALMFVFTFLFVVVSTVLHSQLFAGLIVFGGLIAAGVVLSRARRVIIKP